MAPQKSKGAAHADTPHARENDQPALEERFARLTSRVEELERRLFELEGTVTPSVVE